jgi:hypothetical protein
VTGKRTPIYNEVTAAVFQRGYETGARERIIVPHYVIFSVLLLPPLSWFPQSILYPQSILFALAKRPNFILTKQQKLGYTELQQFSLHRLISRQELFSMDWVSYFTKIFMFRLKWDEVKTYLRKLHNQRFS